jgi:hypothetical protein
MDFTALVGAVDFASAGTAIMSVAVALAGVYVASKGARLVLGFLGR